MTLKALIKETLYGSEEASRHRDRYPPPPHPFLKGTASDIVSHLVDINGTTTHALFSETGFARTCGHRILRVGSCLVSTLHTIAGHTGFDMVVTLKDTDGSFISTSGGSDELVKHLTLSANKVGITTHDAIDKVFSNRSKWVDGGLKVKTNKLAAICQKLDVELGFDFYDTTGGGRSFSLIHD